MTDAGVATAIDTAAMKIGIIGAGNIGSALAHMLRAAGHGVKIANSRGADTIDPGILADGVRAVTSADAVAGVDVVILSMPFHAATQVAPLFAYVPTDTVVIDTANYFPMRDGRIAPIEDGQAESEWVAEQLGRPIAKAWNAITFASLVNKGQPAGTVGRVTIPVAAERDRDATIAMALIDQTGLDAVLSGPLSQSWRQQPGAPSYCTDLTRDELSHALASAERARLPRRRDIVMEAIKERFGDRKVGPDSEYEVRLTRAVFM